MYWMITLIAIGADGPLGKPVLEQVTPKDLLDGDHDQLGRILQSMAVESLKPDQIEDAEDLHCGSA
jgi:hypothetical protein